MVVSIIAASHALAGRTDEAERAIHHLRQLDPGLRISNLKDWLPIHRPGDLATFADCLRQAGLPEWTTDVSFWHFGGVPTVSEIVCLARRPEVVGPASERRDWTVSDKLQITVP